MDTWLDTHCTLIGSILAAASGALAWTGQVELLPTASVFLLLVLIQPSRRAAYAVAASYYAASSWSLVPGAHAFFGPESTVLKAGTLWLTASTLLAAPWGLFHFRGWPARLGSVPLALLATIIPP